MKHARRRPGGRIALLALAACLLAPAGNTALAQTAQTAPDDAAQAAEPMTPEQRRQQAREERIRRYLERKEQKRLERLEREAQQRAAADPGAPPARRGEPLPAGMATAELRNKLPRDLAGAQDRVAASAMGEDPTVQVVMRRIDRQEAGPHELAAFGNFVAENGLQDEAIGYYRVALDLEPDDSLLWTNLGTLYRQIGELSPAMNAYGRAQRLDPHNPQAANNDRLLAVRLMLYQDTAGSLGLPLLEVRDNGPVTVDVEAAGN